jgi:hypothetical protein
MINNYNTFILESKVYDLILESKISFGEDFIKILKRIIRRTDNPIAKELLDMNTKDVDLDQNFIHLSKENDMITFLSDKKVLSSPPKYKIISNNIISYDIHKETLLQHFKIDRYDPRDSAFSIGTIGTIIDKFEHNSNNTVCHFRTDDGHECAMVMSSLEKINDIKPSEMKIGRYVRKSLDAIKKKFSDKDIEVFVNEFKSEINISNDVYSNFIIVNGDDIKKYYDHNSYALGSGTLSNSCMRYDCCQDFFGIYTENPDKVSLVIYLDENDKLIGRALLWNLDIPNVKFMDRVYTSRDSDVNLFISYAKKNNWCYKKNQNSYSVFDMVCGESTEKYNNDNPIKVQLTNYKFTYYPYMDTLLFMTNDGLLHNSNKIESQYMFKSTSGDGYYCPDCEGNHIQCCNECDGNGHKTCDECSGDGNVSCDNCDGSGNLECYGCDGYGGKDGVTCVECDGSGEITCGECGGEGREICSRCDANGNTHCLTCGGSGEVSCEVCKNIQR